MELLKWLRTTFPWDERTYRPAAESGHFQIWKFSNGREQIVVHGTNILVKLLQGGGGHLKVLKWLRANGSNMNTLQALAALEMERIKEIHSELQEAQVEKWLESTGKFPKRR